MNDFYENVLLREEFHLLKELQDDHEFKKYVTVKYEDRVTGEIKPVTTIPTANRYPEKYIVDYRMSVFVANGQLRNDYNGTAKITLSEPVLTNRRADNGPLVEWSSNFEPFNNHVRKDWICTGNAWTIAKDHGLWHFIVSLGALINQDEFVCSEGGHINELAYDYWVRRDRKPITNIKWPLDLTTRKRIEVFSKPTQKPKISIVKKTAEKQPIKKITIIKK